MKTNVIYAGALLCAALIGSTLAMATAAHAASEMPVSLLSDAKIERVEIGKDGKEHSELKNPADVVVVPGDKVVFTLSYANAGASPAAGFRATNPMPAPVQFVAVSEDWAEVSVDGGKIWGKLGDLVVNSKGADGVELTRAAVPEDVTHVRWVFADAIAPGSHGTLSYRGVIK